MTRIEQLNEDFDKLLAQAGQILEVEPSDTNTIWITNDTRLQLKNNIDAVMEASRLELNNQVAQIVAESKAKQ